MKMAHSEQSRAQRDSGVYRKFAELFISVMKYGNAVKKPTLQ